MQMQPPNNNLNFIDNSTPNFFEAQRNASKNSNFQFSSTPPSQQLNNTHYHSQQPNLLFQNQHQNINYSTPMSQQQIQSTMNYQYLNAPSEQLYQREYQFSGSPMTPEQHLKSRYPNPKHDQLGISSHLNQHPFAASAIDLTNFDIKLSPKKSPKRIKKVIKKKRSESTKRSSSPTRRSRSESPSRSRKRKPSLKKSTTKAKGGNDTVESVYNSNRVSISVDVLNLLKQQLSEQCDSLQSSAIKLNLVTSELKLQKENELKLQDKFDELKKNFKKKIDFKELEIEKLKSEFSEKLSNDNKLWKNKVREMELELYKNKLELASKTTNLSEESKDWKEKFEVMKKNLQKKEEKKIFDLLSQMKDLNLIEEKNLSKEKENKKVFELYKLTSEKLNSTSIEIEQLMNKLKAV
ncbi:hypothetical protein HDU92_008890 [Lobulomyces angularis]|nr:hypothetical protein HDU92_008890 [Lobulomyces angularis]